MSAEGEKRRVGAEVQDELKVSALLFCWRVNPEGHFRLIGFLFRHLNLSCLRQRNPLLGCRSRSIEMYAGGYRMHLLRFPLVLKLVRPKCRKDFFSMFQIFFQEGDLDITAHVVEVMGKGRFPWDL